MTVGLALTLLLIGLIGAFVSGLLGVGGAIVMLPLLLYVPPLLGVGRLSVKAVAGVTMVQVLVAAASGLLAHRRHKSVNRELATVGGLAMAAGSLAGAVASFFVPEWWLLLVFALMVTGGGALLLLPLDLFHPPAVVEPGRYSLRRTVAVAVVVGMAAGMVGAGGAFLLVPLLLVVVGVPLRITIGSSLAITALAALAGVLGKLATGQVPYLPAALVALAAVPGAQLGAWVSRRLTPEQLRLALAAMMGVIAVRVWWSVLTH